MTCNPATTISAQDITDLKADISTIDVVVESNLLTTTTKDAKVIDTLAGRLTKLGFQAPVTYAASIVFLADDFTKTIERNGIVYAPNPSDLPFTTSGTWVADDEDKFFVVQGVTLYSGDVIIPKTTVSAMDADANLLTGNVVQTEGYTTSGDRGSNLYLIGTGFGTADNGSVFDLTGSGLQAKALFPNGVVNVKQFGAPDDGVTNAAPAVQAAVNYVGGLGGGRIHTPATATSYFLSTANVDNACVFINFSNITLSGDGAASLYKTGTNAHVPFHFSDEINLTVVPAGTELTDFEAYGIAIQGTGIYENFPLAKGRGILCRNVKNVSIHNNTIKDMSMIGIVVENGDGYINTTENQLHDNKYGSINYNGRCYQSNIAGNICSGSNGDVNSLAIQATGHSQIYGNTVFGDIALPGNAGGIGWGEGNYDGIGAIYGNLVKHCFFGIKAIFHGSCNVYGNTLINCIGQGGLVLSGSTSGGFTVANSDNEVTGNIIINCQPFGIDCSSEDSNIHGNTVRTFTPILNPSASSEPDFIIGVTTTQGIRIRAAGCSVTNNKISGCTHGLTTTIDQVNGIIGGNDFKGNTNDYSLESATSGVFAATGHAVIEREYASPNTYRERIFRAARPTQGYFDLSSEWKDPTPAISSPIGEIVLFAVQTTAAVGEPAGETVIELASTAGIFADATQTVVGIELDNGAWHWTTVTVVASPNITIGVAIPVGRSVPVGADVFYNSWRPLADLS